MNFKNKLIVIGLTLIAGLLFTHPAEAQDRGNEESRVSPNAMVSQTIGTTEVTVTYGRPSVNERAIFGDLVPFGQVWRTGANEATTITFSDDVQVEGESVSAGTYSLFTIPDEESWTVIINNIANQWGAFDYEESEDLIRVEVNPEEGPDMEQLLIYFEDIDENSGTLVVHWDDTRVPVTIEN